MEQLVLGYHVRGPEQAIEQGPALGQNIRVLSQAYKGKGLETRLSESHGIKKIVSQRK